MERRSLLAAFLSILILMGWYYIFPQPTANQAIQKGEKNIVASNSSTSNNPDNVQKASSLYENQKLLPANQYLQPKIEEKKLQNNYVSINVSNKSGSITKYELIKYDAYKPYLGTLESIKNIFSSENKAKIENKRSLMELISKKSEELNFSFNFKPIIIKEPDYSIVSSSNNKIQFKQTVNYVDITKTISLVDDYLINVELKLQNNSNVSLVGEPLLSINGSYISDKKSHKREYLYFNQEINKESQGSLESDITKNDPAIEWFGIDDKYFLQAIILDKANSKKNSLTISEKNKSNFDIYVKFDTATVNTGKEYVLNYKMYIGPKDSSILNKYNNGLNYAINFGALEPFAKPILYLLRFLYSYLNSYGLSIIILTCIMKTLFFPLTYKQMESAEKMKAFQPQLNELKVKYQDDKNKLNQEMMKFFQEKKINPLGGCLPMLLQMPIWFALYRVLDIAIELYSQSFLYLPDLSESDPYGVSPFFLGILMFFQQKMTPLSPNMDPVQAKMLQYMPLIFASIMFTLPSGLVVYIIVNTLLSILQQVYISKKLKRSTN